MTMDEAAIYNMALSACGSRATVALTSEDTPEAKVCNLWYEIVRDQVFKTAPWPSLRGIARLALNTERDQDAQWVVTDPAPGWNFSYNAPSDMIRPRFQATYNKFDLGLSSANIPLIFSNDYQSLLTYTRRVTLVNLWDVDLQMAVVFALGAHIVRKVSGSRTDKQFLIAQAQDKIDLARVNAANEVDFVLESTPEWLAARGYADTAPVSRYIYPSADFTVSGFGNIT